jgi:hypothetical protein
MGLTGRAQPVKAVPLGAVRREHPEWGWPDEKEQRMSQQHRPRQITLGPRVMFWMWMGTIVVGFAVMIGVVGSGR